MSGIAITLPKANFHSAFGNIITDLVDVPITNIIIFANDYYVGNMYQLSAMYEPLKTSQRGCKWELVNGAEYCSLSEKGVLTIFANANMTTITVRATSTFNTSIKAEKEIVITYKQSPISVNSKGKTLGTLDNVDGSADIAQSGDKILVKESGSSTWTVQDSPPKMVFNKSESEVMDMIRQGTIDNNTLYFCIEE